MMKSSMSVAALLLINNVSAAEVYKRHGHGHRAVVKHRLRANANDNLYPETKPDRKWYELDDFTERIHGTEADDDVSPHDPEVVDAPEDMKRVGNDHEELHNAKLSPNGYYNGFHHKDYEGNYSQKKSHSRHHRGHKRLHRNTLVQLKDHENDTDDFLEDGTYV